MNRKQYYYLLCLLIFGASSCTKTVVETCKKRAVSSVTILELPSGIDIFGDPDLRCDITPSNSNYFTYSSFTVDNVSGLPITISFQTDILLSKETWQMQLVDEDIAGTDEIYATSFDPFGDTGGKIKFIKDGVEVMHLNYTEYE